MTMAVQALDRAPKSSVNRTQKRKWVLALVWAFTFFAIWPVLRRRPILIAFEWRTELGTWLGYVIGALICYCIYRVELRRLRRSRSIALVALIILLTGLSNHLHSVYVDRASGWSSPTNTVWQERLQIDVTRLAPVPPHSYRFLPNGIVLWMQLCRVRFDAARDIYRLVFALLLFYAIYRYARLYTDYTGGIFAVLLVGIVYPISFEHYAGQLNDPLSHLSFVLAFIFLETEDFAFLLTTLLIGSLAKETVLALSGFYVLFCRRDRRYGIKATVLCVASLAIYFAVRLLVLHGTMQYQQVSGVDGYHIVANWQTDWPIPFLMTVGAYVPFLVLGWNKTPASLKRLVFYLLPVLWISSLLFSWLQETRNFMPLVFVLAVVAARYFRPRARQGRKQLYLGRNPLRINSRIKPSATYPK